MMSSIVYLVRHATPDWTRIDIRYDIPPGPPLTPIGEEEAQRLGDFLAAAGIARFYASPLERAWRTAYLAAAPQSTPVMIAEAIAEWRRDEPEAGVLARCLPVLESALDESQTAGPVALVSHGGPIRLLLQHLGLASTEMDFHRRQFDRDNPVPPGGAWRLARNGDGIIIPELVFAPQGFKPFVADVVHV
jgi:probable phosphoglycerate mutase